LKDIVEAQERWRKLEGEPGEARRKSPCLQWRVNSDQQLMAQLQNRGLSKSERTERERLEC
jgi:hypothetical protein